ncbi:MAG: CapA family protein [Candidatus Paceibacterota bacterium]|jgi:poly-gamma-glutamate synthesis protein (capsule biosynthesis protein)
MTQKVILSALSLLAAGVIALWARPTSLNTGVFFWRDGAIAREASILFVGDMMFDRTIRSMSERRGGDYLFACVIDYIKGFDLAVGNLEGTITDNPSLSQRTLPGEAGNTTFTFPTSTAELLRRSGIGAVSIANNHIFDFGRFGVESTREYLTAAGVQHFGDPIDPAQKSLVKDVNGLGIALVGFNQFLGVDSATATVAEIQGLRANSDAIIVFSHWGDEYVPVTDGQRAIAHAFIDAGADAVIGAHPHVIQEHEVYKGKSIYYSLGNFMFDQYWEDAVRDGLVLEAHLSDRSISFIPRHVLGTRGRGPCLSNGL